MAPAVNLLAFDSYSGNTGCSSPEEETTQSQSHKCWSAPAADAAQRTPQEIEEQGPHPQGHFNMACQILRQGNAGLPSTEYAAPLIANIVAR